MQRRAPGNRRATSLLLFGMTMLAGLAPQSSLAAPPTADEVQIYYFITDADGSAGRQLGKQDMEGFVGQARCECQQKIKARVTYQGSSTDETQVNAYVGQNCANAQKSGGVGQFDPCALLASGRATSYRGGPEYDFSP